MTDAPPPRPPTPASPSAATPHLPLTESVDPRYEFLDTWHPAAILDAMWEGQLAAVVAVGRALPALAAAAEAAHPRLARGGRLVYAGAGTSGRLAAQDAAELAPTFSWPGSRAVLLLAGGAAALSLGIEDAEDDAATAARSVAAQAVGPDDVVIGLAASGTTPFTRAAVRAARARGALTVGMANSPASPLLADAEHAVLLDTGAEVIAGSTRMKAGTAQRAALTLFSSLLMVRLGRVHGGLMVDMRASNEKLRARALRMLAAVSGCQDPAMLAQALGQARGRIKTAALVLRGLDAAAAEALLSANGDSLRAALAALPA